MTHDKIWIRFLIMIFLSVFLFCVQVEKAHGEKRITIVFIYDDYSSLSPKSLEVKLVKAFQEYNVPCTFGVIPYVCGGDWTDENPQETAPLTPIKIKMLKKGLRVDILDIAMHGVTHQTIHRKEEGEWTEFSGLDYNRQQRKIAKGKQVLEEMLGEPISAFIPTFNSYDLNTLRALQNLGFKSISGMEYGETEKNISLKFLPATCDLKHLRDAVISARRIQDDLPIIVVIFNSNDILGLNNKSNKRRYRRFKNLLAWIMSQSDIHTRSIGRILVEKDDLSASRFENYNAYLKLSHYLYPFLPPLFVNKFFPIGIFLSSKTALNLKNRLKAFVIFFYLGIFLLFSPIAFWAGYLVFPRSRFLLSVFKFGMPVIFVILLFWAVKSLDFSYNRLVLEIDQYRQYYIRAVTLIGYLGAYTGLWIAFFVLKRKSQS